MSTPQPLPEPWAREFAQESERGRSIGQRGMFVAGASSVTVGIVLQAASLLVTGTRPLAGFSSNAKFTLLIALFCFGLAAILGVVANVTQSAASKGVYGDDLANSLTAARTENDRNTMALTVGGAAEVVGIVFVALTAGIFAFS